MPDRKPVRKDPMAILWAAANRNALTEIAGACDCTPQFVHYVLYAQRRSKDGRVERMLRDMGAPVKCQ